MNTEEIAAGVKLAFVQVFGNKLPYTPQLARINEEYWTSLKHMEFLLALESEFGVRFDGGDAVDMQSIPAVIDRVASRLR